MDIAALSSAMSTSQLVNDASVKVLSMSMDDAQEMSDGLKKMLEMSVTPYIGGNIDVSL